MAKAKKLPSGSWRVRVTYVEESTGKRITESFTAPTKREAERDAAIWNADRKERKRVVAAEGITVGEMIDNYIETARSRKLEKTTLSTYLGYRKYAYTSLLNKRVSTVTLMDVQNALNARAETCESKTVHNEFSFLVTVFGIYREDLNLSKLAYPPIEQREMMIPDDSEVHRLLAAARANNDFYIAVLLAVTMGLRRSEICALEWNDIDMQAQTLTINKALVKDENKDFVIKSTKTAAGKRVNFIPDAVFHELLRLRSLNKRMVNLSPDAITRRYERIREKVNITCRFHDLRHYHASVMLALNVPMKYIVADMGHATPNMVNKVYGHRMKEKERVINRQMDSHATSLLAGELFDYDVPQNVTRNSENEAI